jgi:excisionase family DNA binding protein
MVQGYYTLEEAARILGVGTEELSQMAQKHEVRAFADRGTWRFRTQDIEELARRRGMGSSPDLPIGEAPRPKAHDSPTPKAGAASQEEDIFAFGLGSDSEQVEIGQEIIAEAQGGKKGGKSSGKLLGPKSPTPKPGSDSDVRLVADGSDSGLQVVGERSSDVVPVQDVSGGKAAKKKGDSGTRVVPPGGESDSDVKIVADSPGESSVLGGQAPRTGSDSDVRIEQSPAGPRRDKSDSFLTEEIDLDAELRKAEEAAQAKKAQPKAKPKPKEPVAKTTSPFELTEEDLGLPHDAKALAPIQSDSDSDVELDLGKKDDMSAVDLSSGELKVQKLKDEEVTLGDVPAGVTGSSDSGINLQAPADSGISLEQKKDEGSDEIEFELSLDAETSTPKPAHPAAPIGDSSSEFELTLEDSARLAPLEEEAAPKSKESKEPEKDIFETDFEVPALEDESGSQAVALDESDTDLESSDFDLALGEEDMVTEEESGSQVVALEDEEEVDEAAATVARPGRGGRAAVVEEKEAEEEVLPGRRMGAVAAVPADWGVFTPVVLMVSCLVLFIVGLMSFELLHNLWSYHQPYKASSLVVRGVAGMFYDTKELPED